MITRYDDTKNGNGEHTNSPMITNSDLKISDEFLKILQDNAFNGMNEGGIIDHIAWVLEITEWIKMPNVEENELRLHVFSKSLSGDAEKWWNDEINGTTITWSTCKEFVTASPSKVSTVERTPGSMSCIYHELFSRKDRGWEEPYGDLAETMIWYILKKTRVELIRAF
ncbi:hypothetical protein Tco_0674991 [Tanacetum coccineum]